MKQYVHPVGDVAAIGSIALTLLDYAPKIAAVMGIAWYTYLFTRAAVTFLRKYAKRWFD